MAQVCALAGVAESTVSRAKGGADMKLGTLRKLRNAIEGHAASAQLAE